MFIVYLKTDDLKWLSKGNEADPTILETYDWQRNQDVTITGTLRIQSDYAVRYTHMIETEKYGNIALKSSIVSLSSYAWEVRIQGTIIDVIDDELIVLNVLAVDVIQTDADPLTGEAMTDRWIYNAGAWLHFPNAMFTNYRIVNSSARTITIQNIQTQETTEIKYFVCKADNSDSDCSKLTDLFEQTAEKQFTTIDGITYYKQSEVNSWFMTNNNKIGYFINDASEIDVTNISRYIVVPNTSSVDTYLVPYIKDICQNTTYNLQTNEDIQVAYENWKFIAKVSWLTNDETSAECLINIDFSNSQGGTLAQFDISEQSSEETPEESIDDGQDSEDESNQQANTADVKFTYDPNVEQFAIDTQKPFIFTSNRGHTVSFPTQNIAFGQVELQEDVALSEMGCYAQQNVVSYPNKDMLETNPSIQIFECAQPGNEIVLGQQYIRIDLTDKVFFIKLLDSAWIDFANNISIVAIQ